MKTRSILHTAALLCCLLLAAQPAAPAPEKEQPEQQGDHQDGPYGPHCVYPLQQQPQTQAPQQRGQDAPFDFILPFVQPQQQKYKQQQQAGVQRLGEDKGAQHYPSRVQGPEPGGQHGGGQAGSLPGDGEDEQAGQAAEHKAQQRPHQHMLPEYFYEQSQETGIAQDMGVHGHIFGAVYFLSLGYAQGTVPIGLVVAEGLDWHQDYPDKAHDQAQQGDYHGAAGRSQTAAQAAEAAEGPFPFPQPQQQPGGYGPGGQSRQVGRAFQTLSESQQQGQGAYRYKYGQHYPSQTSGNSLHLFKNSPR